MVFMLWELCFFIDRHEVHSRVLLQVKQTMLSSWSGCNRHRAFGKFALGL